MPTRRRRSRWIPVLIAVVVALLLAEVAVVVWVFVSPRSTEVLQGVVADASDLWNGVDDEPGVRTKTATFVADAYRDWVRPLWAGGDLPGEDREFSECVECHPRYGETRNFGSVFMDHPLHAQIGVACATCHTQNAHPGPSRPTEQVCETCHPQVETKGECSTCHPPGALPHFYLLGAPRDSVVECQICHTKDSFDTTAEEPLVDVGPYTGAAAGDDCLSCHETETCSSCHQSPTHPAGWTSAHGEDSLGNTTCVACHTTTWCADRCHAVTPSNPFQTRPLPTVGVNP